MGGTPRPQTGSDPQREREVTPKEASHEGPQQDTTGRTNGEAHRPGETASGAKQDTASSNDSEGDVAKRPAQTASKGPVEDQGSSSEHRHGRGYSAVATDANHAVTIRDTEKTTASEAAVTAEATFQKCGRLIGRGI